MPSRSSESPLTCSLRGDPATDRFWHRQESAISSRPTLVLIGGAPATGKTTLARRLGEALPAPVVDKDSIKSGLCLANDLEAGRGDPVGARSIELACDAAALLLAGGCTTVLEIAFHRPHFPAVLVRFERLADVRLLTCHAPIEESRRRYEHRAGSETRRFAHDDRAVVTEMASGVFDWAAYDLDGLAPCHLQVDTTDGYRPSLSDIVAFASC